MIWKLPIYGKHTNLLGRGQKSSEIKVVTLLENIKDFPENTQIYTEIKKKVYLQQNTHIFLNKKTTSYGSRLNQ